MVDTPDHSSWWQVLRDAHAASASVTPILPSVLVGNLADDDGTPATGEDGTPIFDTSQNQLISAIFAIAQEIRDMSASFSDHFDAMVASLKTVNDQQAAAIAELTDKIAKLEAAVPVVGNVVTDAQVTALQMQIDAAATNATHTEGLVAPPAVTPPVV